MYSQFSNVKLQIKFHKISFSISYKVVHREIIQIQNYLESMNYVNLIQQRIRRQPKLGTVKGSKQIKNHGSHFIDFDKMTTKLWRGQ